MKLRGVIAAVILSSAIMAQAADVPPFAIGRLRMKHEWSKIAQMPRHRMATTDGVPEPYAAMHSPLEHSRATIARGLRVYRQHCISCHGATGDGEGEAGRRLNPPPGDLAWLSEMKISRFDGFMYWTIAEGGAPIGSAMPAYKDQLPADDIWAVIAFIQAQILQGRP